MGQEEDATTVASIVASESGEIITIGDLPCDWYPKLARAMVKMHAELMELRKLDKTWGDDWYLDEADSTKFPD